MAAAGHSTLQLGRKLTSSRARGRCYANESASPIVSLSHVLSDQGVQYFSRYSMVDTVDERSMTGRHYSNGRMK